MRKLHFLMMSILLLTSECLLAQKKEVTGTVIDPSGTPIPNATIKIKGTNKGTSANFDGSFKLTIPGDGILVVSAVGYEQKEVKPGTSPLSIQLNQASRSQTAIVLAAKLILPDLKHHNAFKIV